jgi:hypothetical protein
MGSVDDGGPAHTKKLLCYGILKWYFGDVQMRGRSWRSDKTRHQLPVGLVCGRRSEVGGGLAEPHLLPRWVGLYYSPSSPLDTPNHQELEDSERALVQPSIYTPPLPSYQGNNPSSSCLRGNTSQLSELYSSQQNWFLSFTSLEETCRQLLVSKTQRSSFNSTVRSSSASDHYYCRYLLSASDFPPLSS